MRLVSDLFPFGSAETAGDRRFFRMFEAFILLEASVLAWTWADYIGQLSGIVYPLGLANYVDLSVLFRSGAAYYVAALISALCVAGYLISRFRPAYLIALLLLHLLYVSRYSLGKVAHGSNLIGMCLLSIALASILYSDPFRRRTVALGLARFSVGFSYVLAACSKLVGTGLSWPAGSHLGMWIAEKGTDVLASSGHFEPNALQSFLVDHAGWSTLILAGGLVTEALGWLYWFRSTRPFITVALVGMHIGIALTMNIRFDLFVAVLIVLGFEWSGLLDRIVRSGTSDIAHHGARKLS